MKEHLLEDEASPFPVQAGGGGCQQWLTGGLYTGGSFQGGNINLPVPPKFEEAEGGICHVLCSDQHSGCQSRQPVNESVKLCS